MTLSWTTFIIRSMILTAFRTRMGWVAVLADLDALRAMSLPQPTRKAALANIPAEFVGESSFGTSELIDRTRARIERYVAGARVAFDDLRIDVSYATEFQRDVWKLTRSIPYGATRTYRELAQQVARPNAARAIGQCMARNPLPIIIPCHRVVGTAGDLRGFGGGIDMKRALLKMEGVL